ncbi:MULTISPECIES: Stk1 family PASTA domain-containing Ser/Thr kinase [Actinomadura]|uniref:Stk1 family PASTA domain-containing Ser/Thr kinase n=1 Tax=Actinomadura TaxID=1988 RepID=UPI001563CFF6|nr:MULTISPECIES: Stk1 family PASTA domain-containing Ser/Thr kinase [Actinomadura]MBT2209699.1 Stk1 family PASTA domain-containing Ser/Thr kinase [Actinomadura sp. NEAU-AAG7]
MDATATDPLVGRVLDGRYRIESRVARGGMATVYVARDIRLDRVIAIKVMHAALAADEDFVARFIGEAKSAAALSHPNVVAVYDQVTDGEHVFLVMEYVEGHTLRDALTAAGRFGPRAALEIMQPVLAALGAAHRAGLVHRDVKPENVLITEDGRVKVADFGLARAESASKMTRTGVIIGTVGYLAPEQVVAGHVDVRTDVYAAGIMLYELVTGRLPHQADTAFAVAYKHVNETVPPPSEAVPGIPRQVDDLVTDATSHEPDRRPRDANQFLAEVAEAYNGLPRDFDQRMEQPTTTVEMHAPAPHTAVMDRRELPRERGRADRAIGVITGRYVLIAVGAVVAMVLGWAVWYETSGQYDHVPEKIVGMKVADARAKLEGGGLDVRVAKAVYDDRVRKGEVARSDPPAGARVAKGETVTLTPSRGRSPREVPDVEGKSLADARRILGDKGFTVGQTSTNGSQTVSRDRVISSDPPAGERRSPDEPVDLVISSGMSMPNLVGIGGENAANQLRSMGLDVKIDKRKVDGKPAATVVSQDPPMGTGVSRGDHVTLVVNEDDCKIDIGPVKWGCKQGGEEDIPVPNLMGRNVDEAKAALEDSGFKVTVTGIGGDTVRFQNPSSGEAPRGSTITLLRGP